MQRGRLSGSDCQVPRAEFVDAQLLLPLLLQLPEERDDLLFDCFLETDAILRRVSKRS